MCNKIYFTLNIIIDCFILGNIKYIDVMNKEDRFFRKNEIRLSGDNDEKDYKISPELHYLSFYQAIENYFKTVNQYKKTFHFILQEKYFDRKGIAFNFSRNKTEVISSIISFHRFIELHYKFILKTIHKNLVYKIDKKNPGETIWECYQSGKGLQNRYVDYREAVERVNHILKNKKDFKDTSGIINEYHFLLNKETKNTLNHLSTWRNRIVHNGNTLPNIFAYEYLITQLVLPLTNRLFNSEKKRGYEINTIETQTGIDIIDSLVSIKFEINEFDNYYLRERESKIKFLNIFHLKELGRASMNISNFSTSALIPGPISRRIEENNSISIPEKIAELETNDEFFHSLDMCTCCGKTTRITYKRYLPPLGPLGDKNIMWFACYNCGYYLEDVTLDPCKFDLADKPVFEFD